MNELRTFAILVGLIVMFGVCLVAAEDEPAAAGADDESEKQTDPADVSERKPNEPSPGDNEEIVLDAGKQDGKGGSTEPEKKDGNPEAAEEEKKDAGGAETVTEEKTDSAGGAEAAPEEKKDGDAGEAAKDEKTEVDAGEGAKEETKEAGSGEPVSSKNETATSAAAAANAASTEPDVLTGNEAGKPKSDNETATAKKDEKKPASDVDLEETFGMFPGMRIGEKDTTNTTSKDGNAVVVKDSESVTIEAASEPAETNGTAKNKTSDDLPPSPPASKSFQISPTILNSILFFFGFFFMLLTLPAV